MKHFFLFIFTLIALMLTSCQDNSTQENYRQYVFLRYDDYKSVVRVNDGSVHYSYDEPTLKDKNGIDIKFQSLTSAINYMVLQGWKFEGAITNHPAHIATEDASLLFSKPTTKEDLEQIVKKGYME